MNTAETYGISYAAHIVNYITNKTAASMAAAAVQTEITYDLRMPHIYFQAYHQNILSQKTVLMPEPPVRSA